jgi:hypothetical protein
MSTDTLGAIFNSPARVKVMRLFLLNRDTVFAPNQVASWINVSPASVRKELGSLARAGFIKKKKDGWLFDQKFEYTDSLYELLFGTEFVNKTELAAKFKRTGRIKLLLLSGIFTQNSDARLDLLLVGDNLKRPAVERIIRSLEGEIGREVAYAAFESEEFVYRASMYDKLIRDIIDFPHEKVVNVGGLLQRVPQVQV